MPLPQTQRRYITIDPVLDTLISAQGDRHDSTNDTNTAHPIPTKRVSTRRSPPTSANINPDAYPLVHRDEPDNSPLPPIGKSRILTDFALTMHTARLKALDEPTLKDAAESALVILNNPYADAEMFELAYLTVAEADRRWYAKAGS